MCDARWTLVVAREGRSPRCAPAEGRVRLPVDRCVWGGSKSLDAEVSHCGMALAYKWPSPGRLERGRWALETCPGALVRDGIIQQPTQHPQRGASTAASTRTPFATNPGVD